MKKFLTCLTVVGVMLSTTAYGEVDPSIQDINNMVNQKEQSELTKLQTDKNNTAQKKAEKEDIEARKDAKITPQVQGKSILQNVANTAYIVSLESQSKQELQMLYDRGFRLFEISVSATSDSQVVLAKNFDFYFNEFYGLTTGRPTIDQYFSYKMLNGQSQMSIGDINQFLNAYPDARFFVKSDDQVVDNIQLLNGLSIKNKDKIIPEITKVLNPYQSFDNVALVDLKGENDIYSYVVNNKTKDIFLFYKNYVPSETEKKHMQNKNVKMYMTNDINNATVSKVAPTGQFYTASQALSLALEPVNQVAPTIYKRPQITNDRYVAHAGGEIAGLIGTNSYQSLTENYKKGARIFELDFDLTTDNHIVAVHDWGTFAKLAQRRMGNLYLSLEEFKSQNLLYALKQMTIEDVLEFLKTHKAAYIVTDVKGDIKALKAIAEKSGDLKNRFIPQIYSTDQYQDVKNYGFDNIIFTLYRTSMSDYNVIDFAKRNDLYAVTMDNTYRAATKLPMLLSSMGQRVYFHTENDDMKTISDFESNQAYGVYSDTILTDDILRAKLAVNTTYQALLQKRQEEQAKQANKQQLQQAASKQAKNLQNEVAPTNIF